MTSETSHFDGAAFSGFPVIGILRGFETQECLGAAKAAVEAGLTAVEITLNSAHALQQIGMLRETLPDVIRVGAGTVTRAEDVRRAIAAGAQFIVSPVYNPAVMAAALENDVPVFPGAMTPTEILAAHAGGATMVKLFPAGALGAEYLKSVKGPLDQVRLLPTGGVGLNNVAKLLCAGADGFGIGGPLFQRQKVCAGDWNWVRCQVKRFRDIIRNAQND